MDAIPTIEKTKAKKKRSIVPGATIKAKKQKNKKSSSGGGTSISIGSSVLASTNRTKEQEINEEQQLEKTNISTDEKYKENKALVQIHGGIAQTTETAITTTTFSTNRHPWELNPKWNIEAPKEGQKTMADFCTKYKPPPVETDEEGNVINNTSSILKARREHAAEMRKRQQQEGDTPQAQVKEQSNNGPQVQIINGEIVIEESSLLLHQHKTIEQLDEELGGQEVVEDNTLLTASYSSFKKKTDAKRKKWPPEDVYDLYTAIRSYGPDFSLIETFFKERYTRKEIRLKFKKELRDNEKLMDMALYGGGTKNNVPKLDIPSQVTTKNDKEEDTTEKQQEQVMEEDEPTIKQQPEPLSLEEKYASLFDDEEPNNDNNLKEQEINDASEQQEENDSLFIDEFDGESQSQHTNATNTSLSILGGGSAMKKKKKNKFKIKKKK